MIDKVVGRDSVNLASLVDHRYEIGSFRHRAIKDRQSIQPLVYDSIDRSTTTQRGRDSSFSEVRQGISSRKLSKGWDHRNYYVFVRLVTWPSIIHIVHLPPNLWGHS